MALSWLAVGVGWALLLAVLAVVPLPAALAGAADPAWGSWAIWLPAIFGVSSNGGSLGIRAASALCAVVAPALIQGVLARLAFPARSGWDIP
ncbi:MAG: hypothetical protein ACKOZX_05915, partial [Gammaproteobacteria bacterium]